MTIVILDASGFYTLVGQFRHVGPGEIIVRAFAGYRHSERADALLGILDAA